MERNLLLECFENETENIQSRKKIFKCHYFWAIAIEIYDSWRNVIDNYDDFDSFDTVIEESYLFIENRLIKSYV